MQLLIDFLNDVSKIPKTSSDKLISLVRLKEFKKEEEIAKLGEIPKDVYVIKKGIIRSYFTDEKGKNYIRHIFTSSKTTGALGSLITNKPSKLTYDCLSDCTVYAINFKALKKLASKDKAIANFYASVLENIFITLESKIYDLSVLNATERYLKLKKEIPNIENLIPQYHIASYLNITPVQLSRIRKEIYSK